MSQKTEAPTPKRLRRAREEGDSGGSRFFSESVGFFVLVLLAAALGGRTVTSVVRLLESALFAAGQSGAPDELLDPWAITKIVLIAVVPPVACAAVASAAVMLVQTGGVFAAKRIAPDFGRLGGGLSLTKLLSRERLFVAFRSLGFALFALWLGATTLSKHLADMSHTAGRPALALRLGVEMISKALLTAAAVGLVFGLVDLLVGRAAWTRRLRMSRSEVLRERRDNDGDPLVKDARRRVYDERLAEVDIANVRTASVVFVSPADGACAVRYSQDEGARPPVVVALGRGDMARRIVEAARAYNVTAKENPPLVRALLEVSVGEPIPEAFYEPVAEALRGAG